MDNPERQDETPAAEQADAWNAAYPAGTRVRYFEVLGRGHGRLMLTRTAASVLGGHTAVVWLEGLPGCVPLWSLRAEPEPRPRPQFGGPFVELGNELVRVSIEARPPYCDRGRWVVNAESCDLRRLTIDFADGFPRYYFGWEALVSEVEAWLSARGLPPDLEWKRRV